MMTTEQPRLPLWTPETDVAQLEARITDLTERLRWLEALQEAAEAWAFSLYGVDPLTTAEQMVERTSDTEKNRAAVALLVAIARTDPELRHEIEAFEANPTGALPGVSR